MKPTVKIAATRTPDGGEMALYQHDRDFSIKINGQELMHSRQHESELELARLGCAHLARRKDPRILIGGLGMGYTLRETLDIVGHDARAVVVELLGEVVKWNREFLGELNGRPLDDKRVHLRQCDVVQHISSSENEYDAILLDIDNGPSDITNSGNRRLYNHDGIRACCRALRNRGCLAVWSAEPSKKFERRMVYCGFQVCRYRAPAYKGSKSNTRFIWVASGDKAILPPGGGEPRPLPESKKPTRKGPARRSNLRVR